MNFQYFIRLMKQILKFKHKISNVLILEDHPCLKNTCKSLTVHPAKDELKEPFCCWQTSFSYHINNEHTLEQL